MVGSRVQGGLVLALGIAALWAPFLVGDWTLAVLGLLLLVGGAIELGRVLSTADRRARASAYVGGLLSIVAGAILFGRPTAVLSGLLGLVGIVLATSGTAKLLASLRAGDRSRVRSAFDGAIDLLLGMLVWSARGVLPVWALGLLVGIHLVSVGWRMLLADRSAGLAAGDGPQDAHPDVELALGAHPELGRVTTAAAEAASIRAPIDRRWCLTLIAIFFAIHVGRMQASWSVLGMVSPFVAVLGDVLSAILVSLAVVIPVRLLWRRLTRPVERGAWRERLRRVDAGRSPELGERLTDLWLDRRLAFALRLKAARQSLATTLWHNVQLGLPLVALLVAVNPIWGFSWYFNTENWASGVWQEVAARRTDSWREHMVAAVMRTRGVDDPTRPGLFEVAPDGDLDGDFAFLVIGDPGEGDASQLSLTERYLDLTRRPDVRFLVISSDVIYPDGAMRDYEPNFYLPFKGVRQPIYGLPGNHDWFAALTGFDANFLEPDAARASMRARVEADHRLTSTTDARIEELLAEAARLRTEYRIRTGEQRAPYFELRTPGFTLVVVDTGVLRRVDPLQQRWLEAALARAEGGFTMAILGHPLYAGGVYQGATDEPFDELHALLRRHAVDVVMAGDTHDFEYYREAYVGRGGREATMHHVLNGGGGAYLSIGTALAWPREPPVDVWAFYPPTAAVRAKLARETPAWKRPFWWWVDRLGAWPLPVEVLSGIFDFNRAPFFQSFVEVQVLRSRGVVRFVLHGVHGPLRWRDVQHAERLPADGATDDDAVVLTVPLATHDGTG